VLQCAQLGLPSNPRTSLLISVEILAAGGSKVSSYSPIDSSEQDFPMKTELPTVNSRGSSISCGDLAGHSCRWFSRCPPDPTHHPHTREHDLYNTKIMRSRTPELIRSCRRPLRNGRLQVVPLLGTCRGTHTDPWSNQRSERRRGKIRPPPPSINAAPPSSPVWQPKAALVHGSVLWTGPPFPGESHAPPR
jgi:hypothetical protein